MHFGGFSPSGEPRPRPVGSQTLSTASQAWKFDGVPIQTAVSRGRDRRVLIIGLCGVSSFELLCLADSSLPDDVAWRWPGKYTVVEESEDSVIVYTDPAATQPVYITAYRDGWAWSSSARMLAALSSAPLDTQRLTCSVLLPTVPTLTGTRTFFNGVEQLSPGSRTVIPALSGNPRTTVLWRPEPDPSRIACRRLRDALSDAVALRVAACPDLSCDLSGGLDSTSIAVLAANALPSGTRLDAVTIHPEGDQSGADLHYARITAAAHAQCITHRLLPMTAEHLPYTRITTVPPTDEPAPSTLTQARLLGQLRWMRTRTHLTGDGGDSVLFLPPIHLADLIRHHCWKRAVNEATGWARLRHSTVLPLLRDAAQRARTSRSRALAELAETAGAPDRNDHGHIRWFPLLPFPNWAEPPARQVLAQAAERAADTPDDLPGLDASVRTLVDEIREVARTAAADAQLANAYGVGLHNPFLDSTVVNAVLTTPLDQRPPMHAYKPVLGRAMADLLPAAVATRTTKGSFDADHYAGMRANLPVLLALADGHLAELGLIDPARFRSALHSAAAGLPMPLASIEQALATEAWLVAHHREPNQAWTSEPMRTAHG